MMGRISFLFVIVLLQMFQFSICVHAEELESLGLIRCKKHELDALLKFKQSFTKDPKKLLSSWVGEDCCQWHGVTCDNVTDDVVKLNLRSQWQSHYYDDYYSGNDDGYCLPFPQVSMVSSGVSSALLELKLLTHLDLSGNNFSGSRIPEFIGSLRHLRYLNLSSAVFSGPIPPQFGNLTNLVHLDLNGYYICDGQSRYATGLAWASSLLKLQSLDMSGYDLSRAHDTFKVLISHPFLSALSLSNCELHNSHLSEAFTRNTSSFFPTLQHLNLGSNHFDGPLPSVFRNMVSLRSLSLSSNYFTGSVPLWLRAMKRLEVLDLSDNNGFNYVEGGIMRIMGNPCNFKHLDLFANNISQGDILESFQTLSGCGTFKLQYLSLGANNMNGSLPSLLGQLTNLKYLDLSYNRFKGGVPASFVNLSALTHLDLSNNKLNGMIPDLGYFTQIKHLDISSNSLQGTVIGIGNLSKLSYLNMSFNNLNLNLDPSFSWRPPFQLQYLSVHSCLINTVFPQWLRNQTQIEVLDLSYTGISGNMPGWLWNSSYLTSLSLSGNQLTGSLPQHIACDAHRSCNFKWLDLHNNLLTGTIPKWLTNLETLQVIDLSSNLLSGPIFDGNNSSLLFHIGNPLVVLDLSDNLLSGEIQFGNVHPNNNLEILSLLGNHFIGPIRSQLCGLKSLTVLELAQNHLTGHIPRCLGSIGFDNTEHDSILDVQTIEIVKGIVEVSTTTRGPSIIDLSSNYLVGIIPDELTNISALFALNLSYNHLTGHIPENIGNLKMVESLDLSNNCLSGTIPESLSSISWLSMLNLSNNNLHGPIPTGTQLQTLDDPSIYAGNSGLCGFPLPNNCTKPDLNPTTRKDNVEKKDEYEKVWFTVAVMFGAAIGFLAVVGTLVINLSWRQAYFQYVEDLAYRIYRPVKVSLIMFKRRFNVSFLK